MTVHKAKGLEFPVVILADITARLRPARASRYLDPDRQPCAVRLAGLMPQDLADHQDDEREREEAPKACASRTWRPRARAISSSCRLLATGRSRRGGSVR